MNINLKGIKLTLLLITLLASSASLSNNSVVMQGVFNSANIAAGFIVANDIKFGVDNTTRVYQSNGQLRSLKSLKQGQTLELYFRAPSRHDTVSNMVLDKIIYTPN